MSVATVLAPTWCSVPDWHYTLGPEVAELCDAAGYTPDPNQAAILDAAFAVGRDGRPAAFEVAVIAPRQNLKTGAEKMIALGLAFLLERRRVVWSAHEYATAQEAFLDLKTLIEGSDFLMRRVKRILAADGRELFELDHGRQLQFKARTKGSGRGLTGDATILDEAFALKASHLGALLPTMVTKPHALVVYGSSAGLFDSAELRKVRDRGRAGADRLAYFEWGDTEPERGCASEDCDHAAIREGCALDDRARWHATNPALSVGRITEDAIADLRSAMPPEEFARECLGWWDEPSELDQALTVADWQQLAGDGRPGDPVRFAVDVGAGHASSSIVACGTDGGVPVVELVERRAGSSWLVERCLELAQTWHPRGGFLVDPAGPIGSLIPALMNAGVELSPVEGKDAVRACGSLIAAVADQSFRHRGEPAFDAAVAGARLRAVGDGNKWSRKNSTVDITPLVAATWALYAASTARPPMSEADLLASFG